jgi:hypothetical protein
MKTHRWHARVALGLVLCVLMGCSPQAAYMRGWEPLDRITNRWQGGAVRPTKLTHDEAAVLDELGTPDQIRFFRNASTREPVYEWIYKEPEQLVWFNAGQRVEYVAVDASPAKLTAAERNTVRSKAVTGGFLAGAIGGLAAGFLLLSEDIGLKD